MAQEIERKFLVDLAELGELEGGRRIKQGYIPTTDGTEVRVRLKGPKAFLTLKGKKQGATRLEFEYGIPTDDAEKILIELYTGPVIDKTRYKIEHGGHTWELDVFHGDNHGLVMVEVELESEDVELDLPSWTTEEVTHDDRYYNANLLKSPFKTWG